MRALPAILIITVIAIAAWWYFNRKTTTDPSSDNIFDRGDKKLEAAKPIKTQNDVGDLAQLLHLTMDRPFYKEFGVIATLAPVPLILRPAAAYFFNKKDFTNYDSWKGLLGQTDKNIVAVNNYFNARYKSENKGNLYNWIKNERQLPFSDARAVQTKLIDKFQQLHLS